jgi:hypothetical protein
MSILNRRYFSLSILLLALLPTGRAVNVGEDPQKDGALVVKVTWGDIDNTPASGVYVEAYGFVEKYDTKKSFVLKMSRDGQYEAPLPMGIYDVFVSDGSSVPRCRRLMIKAGLTKYWTLKLEHDDVYVNEQISTVRSK